MNIKKTILELREKLNLSQEKLAEICGVSRQAVQKWESGVSIPDVENLITVSKVFNVSLDYLILNSTNRAIEQALLEKKILPQYNMLHNWDLYSENLLIEYKQSIEEGKDIQNFEELFTSISKLPPCLNKSQLADILFNIVCNAPQRADYPYIEPSELQEIKKLRKILDVSCNKTVAKSSIEKKIHGAWLGRICGCLLGKPIECIRTDELNILLKQSGNYPMYRYIKSTDLTDEMYHSFNFNLRDKCYADTIECAPIDDDTNYTVMVAMLIEKYSKDFTPYDVSQMWLDNQSKSAYCTAERVAFNNFVNGYFPPNSAVYKNPYREWIGAQIRGDYFGFINPGNPEKAAEMAWCDASISHIKNGIYGEMFVAAMIACAAVNKSIEDIVLGGLSQIPATSRLYEKVIKLYHDYKNHITCEKCFSKIHKMFDEKDAHDWCHTISNALIIVASLLYGGDDYGKSICLAVQAGFDTDCNGATVGAIMGMKNGVDCISLEWTAPINGTLDTSIFNVGKVKIKDMVDLTMKHIEQK